MARMNNADEPDNLRADGGQAPCNDDGNLCRGYVVDVKAMKGRVVCALNEAIAAQVAAAPGWCQHRAGILCLSGTGPETPTTYTVSVCVCVCLIHMYKVVGKSPVYTLV